MAASPKDRLEPLYKKVGRLKPNPWSKGGVYKCDYALLLRLIQASADTGKAENAQTGGVALAVDVWVASELRRAGLDSDAVWPRATMPRTLSQSLVGATKNFRFARDAKTAAIQRSTIAKLTSSAGSARSNVIGGQFPKEVDVVVAAHDRGLEMAVSSKAMTKSYAKNVSNRWEEASGDLLNIRRRFPMAAFGFAYLATTPVVKDDPRSFLRLKDMLRKLGTEVNAVEGSAYDATLLILADWPRKKARLSMEDVPDDLMPDRFFEQMLPALFERSPVEDHTAARTLWQKSKPPGVSF